MKKLTIFILFLGIVSGCNKNIEGVITHDYDNYLEEFNQDITRLGYMPIDFSLTMIRVSDSIGESGAFCHSVELKRSGFTNISVDQYFKNIPPAFQRMVLYHELGHCFLGLQHQEGKVIMTGNSIPLVFQQNEILADSTRLQYVKEMLESSAYR